MAFVNPEQVQQWEEILDTLPLEEILAENDLTVAEALFELWAAGLIQKPEWYERSEESPETSEDS